MLPHGAASFPQQAGKVFATCGDDPGQTVPTSGVGESATPSAWYTSVPFARWLLVALCDNLTRRHSADSWSESDSPRRVCPFLDTPVLGGIPNFGETCAVLRRCWRRDFPPPDVLNFEGRCFVAGFSAARLAADFPATKRGELIFHLSGCLVADFSATKRGERFFPPSSVCAILRIPLLIFEHTPGGVVRQWPNAPLYHRSHRLQGPCGRFYFSVGSLSSGPAGVSCGAF